MPIDNLEEIHLCPEVLIAGQDAGDVHHLGKPYDALPAAEPGKVGGREPGAAHIERCCRDA